MNPAAANPDASPPTALASADEYVRLQAHASLKRVASRFPYITYDGTPSLITEQAVLSRELCAALEDKVDFAGLHIISFELADLSYDRVVESDMLVRQHAQAVADARKIIAQGALGIVTDLLEGLEAKGHDVAANPEKGRLITNLLTVRVRRQGESERGKHRVVESLCAVVAPGLAGG